MLRSSASHATMRACFSSSTDLRRTAISPSTALMRSSFTVKRCSSTMRTTSSQVLRWASTVRLVSAKSSCKRAEAPCNCERMPSCRSATISLTSTALCTFRRYSSMVSLASWGALRASCLVSALSRSYRSLSTCRSLVCSSSVAAIASRALSSSSRNCASALLHSAIAVVHSAMSRSRVALRVVFCSVHKCSSRASRSFS
mmetsp:Transcript_112532/g.298981  ORF Transcript_112532/g.298981 Transcript_112532/m.298981 type:complete len:200 (-) Transcript_112532:406-1005(-)